MKIAISYMVLVLSIAMLTACAQSNANTPSLASNSAATNRLPSPGNYQRSVLQQSSTMVAPARP